MITRMQYEYGYGPAWVFITCSVGAAVVTLE